jgi:hypothetical protein
MRTKFSLVPPGPASSLPVEASHSRIAVDEIASVLPWGEKATARTEFGLVVLANETVSVTVLSRPGIFEST